MRQRSWLSIAAGVLSLLWVLVACVYAEPSPKNTTLRFRARAITRAGVLVEVANGRVLHTGDKLWFEVESKIALHIYVVQLFPDGAAALLYPQAKAGRAQPNVMTRIPVDPFASFQLDAVTGRERVLLIASIAPLKKSDWVLAALVDEVRSKRRWPPSFSLESTGRQSMPTSPTEPLTKPESVGTSANTAAPAGYIEPSFRTRGIRLHSDASELRMQLDAQGVAASLFEFEHAP